MTIKLTPKQEGFCLSYIETGNASEAYRLNYSVQNMKPEAVWVKSSELLNNGKVTVRLAELHKHHQERHNVTVDSITNELDTAIKLAKEEVKPAAMIAGILGKAKLHGLITDKQKVDVSGNLSIVELLQQGRERVGDS